MQHNAILFQLRQIPKICFPKYIIIISQKMFKKFLIIPLKIVTTRHQYRIKYLFFYGYICRPLLTYLFPLHTFSTPWKHQKIFGFLMFSGGRERVHWERKGEKWNWTLRNLVTLHKNWGFPLGISHLLKKSLMENFIFCAVLPL